MRSASITRLSARAQPNAPCSSECFIARRRECRVLEMTIALPLRFKVNAVSIGVCTASRPSVAASGIGASICAASSRSAASLSRTAAQARSSASSTSSPSRAKKPLAWATTMGAASANGTMPMRRKDFSSVAMPTRLEEIGGGDQRPCRIADLQAAIHRHLPQHLISLRLRQLAPLHQQPFGAIDIPSISEPALCFFEFAFERLMLMEARDRDFEYRLEALRTEAIDDIGTDAGTHRSSNGLDIAVACEHHHWSRAVAGYAIQRFERIPARCVHVDEDDVGLVSLHLGDQVGLSAEPHDD